ncbi:IS66 family transposase [Acinetobacter soli]|uniref:IS66 family transposase n=1 Tax=Acinetobacter soli TaxID=487316 RepID=UPI003AA83683
MYRSTLSDWIGRCGVELEPLVNALRQLVLQQQVLHADETPVTIMQMGDDEKNRRKVMFGLMQQPNII